MPVITIETRTGAVSHELSVYYHWQGPEDAPQILWLAGLGQDHLAWGLQMMAFSKKFRCLLMDNRDVGRSGTVEMDYTAQDMANDVAGLLDALNIESINIVGLSLGGLVAQEFAINYPERVQKLVLLSTFPASDAWLTSINESWATLYAQLSPIDYVKSVSPWLYTWRLYQNRPAFLQTLAQRRATNAHPQSVAAHTRQTKVGILHNAVDRLHLIESRTLVIVGAEDILTPPRFSEILAEKIPDAHLVLIPNSGHGGSVENPNEFNATMLQFLES